MDRTSHLNIFIDFKKAFDTVPHCRLLNKLFYYGVQGKFYNWIKVLSSQRQKRVVINGYDSKFMKVQSGVGIRRLCQQNIGNNRFAKAKSKMLV